MELCESSVITNEQAETLKSVISIRTSYKEGKGSDFTTGKFSRCHLYP